MDTKTRFLNQLSNIHPWSVPKYSSPCVPSSDLSANWVMTAANCANLVFIGTYSGDQARDVTTRGSRI